MVFKVIFSFLVLIVSILYIRYQPKSPDINTDKQQVVLAWKRILKVSEIVTGDNNHKCFRRIAIGVNTCVDMIVKGTELLKAASLRPTNGFDHETIGNKSDLEEVFSHYFQKGAAAERFFSLEREFLELITTADSLSYKQLFVGGNAALMAQKMSELSPKTKIQLVGPIGKKLLQLLNKNIEVPSISRVHQDEVHLIMEYQVGEKWGDAITPVATRLIISNDQSNSQLTSLSAFFSTLSSFGPDLIVLSGLHMLDGQSEALWSEKLNTISDELGKLVATTPVHLELASITNKNFYLYLINKIFDSVHSIGLNEQELWFTSTCLNGPHQDLLDTASGQPDIHKVSDILYWLLKTHGYNKETNPTSKLTRIHFHSLTFHIIVAVGNTWLTLQQSVAAGTQIAGLQACDRPAFNCTEVDLRILSRFKLFTGDSDRIFDPDNPVMSWKVGELDFVFSPVLVCKKPLKTVGLGDSISAAGLLNTFYNHPS